MVEMGRQAVEEGGPEEVVHQGDVGSHSEVEGEAGDQIPDTMAQVEPEENMEEKEGITVIV